MYWAKGKSFITKEIWNLGVYFLPDGDCKVDGTHIWPSPSNKPQR